MSVEVYTVDQIADYLHVHSQTVRIWIRQGKLGHVRIGRGVRVADDQLQAFIAAHRCDSDYD